MQDNAQKSKIFVDLFKWKQVQACNIANRLPATALYFLRCIYTPQNF